MSLTRTNTTRFNPVRPKEHEEAAIRALAQIDTMIHTTGTHLAYKRAHVACRTWLRAARDLADNLHTLSVGAIVAFHRANEAFVTAQNVDDEFISR